MPLCCRLGVNRFYQMVTNVFFSFTFKNSNPNPFFEDTKLTKTLPSVMKALQKYLLHQSSGKKA